MTSLLKLIEEFSAREVVPVEVEHVVDFLRAHAIKDEIYFFDPNMDTETLRASIAHWEYPSLGWTYRVADIYTAKSLTLGEKRLLQTKELLHILDSMADRVSILEDVEDLVKQMALSNDLFDPATAGDQALSDRRAIAHALPVMFPMAARAIYEVMLSAGEIDIDGIAEEVVLPKALVEYAMSARWPKLHDKMMSELRSRLPSPDRVITLDAAGNIIEVHSVGIDDDPYYYAKRLEERLRDTAGSPHSIVINTRRGDRKFTAAEMMEYTPFSRIRKAGSRPAG
ncbi:hypothetical protein [Tardiphaga sp.]|uniref:hypothetical protein n=1 Tax=Tardiphaga sp. TaxID=1926292 RepID=UPI00262E59D8|nr:hypothetical protein [Tardiphaga sp.]MDB5617821.1 hypothetical protein [Tardiphaga sp.]